MLALIWLFMALVAPNAPRRQHRRQRSHRGRGRKRLRSALHGAQYVPRQDPPQIVQQPWNNLTITGVITIPAPAEGQTKSAFSVSIKELGDALWKQLGATQNPSLDFKIMRAAVWLTEGSYFNVTFYDLQRSRLANSTSEATLEDSAAKNHYARVGWKWSAADSSVPWGTNSDVSAGKVVLVIEVPTAATCLIHTQVQWRGSIISDPGIQAGKMTPLFQCRQALVTDEQRVTRSVNTLREDLNRDQDRVSLALEDLCSLLRTRFVLVADEEGK